MATVDPYEIVTAGIIKSLEGGDLPPWRQPWMALGYTPKSLSSRKPYRGINTMLLGFQAAQSGYESPWWGTFRQITGRNGTVRKGEKATPVVLWKRIKDERAAAKGEPDKWVVFMRYFSVFCAEQADWEGEPPAYETLAEREFTIIEAAQTVMDDYSTMQPALGWEVGERACYSPSLDRIMLPAKTTFLSDEGFYGTAFHEMAHSTGHKDRLERPGVTESHYFGDATYSEEELVAEFTAAFLSSHTGIVPPNPENHAAYIKSWLKALKDDKKLLVGAVGKAQKAADYILGVAPPVYDDPKAEKEVSE